jgi:hypothetical protein
MLGWATGFSKYLYIGMGMVVLSVFGVLARQGFSIDTALTLLGKLK